MTDATPSTRAPFTGRRGDVAPDAPTRLTVYNIATGEAFTTKAINARECIASGYWSATPPSVAAASVAEEEPAAQASTSPKAKKPKGSEK